MELIFATNNQHKLNEIRRIPSLDKFTILSLKDAGIVEEIPETAPDLQGNALMKARFIFGKYGLNCFADDTGLEIEALDKRPGVYSARYAGEPSDAGKNMQKVLTEMKGKANRSARFVTVLALIIDGKETLFEGIVEGSIIDMPRGSGGFGYDPIFIPDGYAQTFAEMPLEEKNLISHRARAVKKLSGFLAGLKGSY